MIRERIADRQSIDLLAVAHVFGVKRGGSGVECHCDDERVEDGIAVPLRDLDRPLVRFGREGRGLRTEDEEDAQGAANFLPALIELAACYGDELCQDLNR